MVAFHHRASTPMFWAMRPEALAARIEYLEGAIAEHVRELVELWGIQTNARRIADLEPEERPAIKARP